MQLTELADYLSALLDLGRFEKADPSLNGLQVGEEKEIHRVALAVDACGESFERARLAGADLLVVHHGLFWGAPRRLTGEFYRRIKTLVESGLALYAAHLPLDAHPELGHNAVMAARLGLQDLSPFGIYRGLPIGFKGRLAEEADLETLLNRLGLNSAGCPAVFPFGPEGIRTVGLISGAAAGDVEQAIDEGLDLFITGEASHQIYHTCLEGKINFAAAGHYFTETFGLEALAKRITGETGLGTVFLDVPTGL
ncbi:MAG: Nif3-like dinuclear metal center hexameric protein [Spirochaetales bacterium]|jgi:dinuclear metal center YbgI/SA1388 family protein|nr:Nif3-like dinuclear metal center hexameric protein [Spirochaetales bacterium]